MGTCSFNKDGTTNHSARGDGTYIATPGNQKVVVNDKEELTLKFPSPDLNVGDEFEVEGTPLRFKITAVVDIQATMAVAGKKLTITMVAGPDVGTEFTCSFNKDGTTNHSARGDGTYIATPGNQKVVVNDKEEL